MARKYYINLNILTIISILCFLHANQIFGQIKETVLDRKIHIEDSIHYSIPPLPRLCDELKFKALSINVGNCNLHVEMEGNGIPVVLINGGPGGTHHYFHPWFSELKRDHKVIYYDQRGTGESDFENGGAYSFLQAVNDLEELRKQLNIEKWIVCGYSYGGGIAQVYSILHTESLLGMILINPLPLLKDSSLIGDQEKYFSIEEQKRKEEIIQIASTGKFTMPTFLYNLSLNGDWKRQHFYKPTKEEMIRSALYEWVNDRNFNSIVSNSYNNYNLEGCFITCPIPTLIFEGEHDLTWGDKKARAIRENHPNAKFILVKQVAHPIFTENSRLFFSEIKAFTADLQEVPESKIREWQKKIRNKTIQFKG